MDSIRDIRDNWIFPALALLLLAVVFRFFSFFPSVINHDESTYILIAREMLHGKHYFVDVIDTKPIGIFLIYGFFQWLGLQEIFLLRLLTALWVGATAFGLFAIANRHLGGFRAAWTAGVGYILMTSIFTYYGVSPNTELFFNGFTVLALWWLLGGTHWWRYLFAGGALGVGFLIKYVVAIDALAFGLLVLWLAYARERYKGLVYGIGRGLLMVAGFVAPFGLTYWYYRLLGYESTFLYYTFVVPGRYPVDVAWWETVVYYLDFLGRFFPVTLLAGYALLRGRQLLDRLYPFFLVWILLDAFIIGWPEKNFGHYFIQLMVPFSLLAGAGLALDPPFLRWWRRRPLPWRWGLALVLATALLLTQKKDYYDRWDHPREVAAYLADRLTPGDQLYTGNYHQILYYLLERETPTPYVHRSLLWDAHHVRALGIDLERETRQILALRPRFLTLERPVPDTPLSEALYRYYRRIEVIGDRIEIYERK